MHLIIVKHAGVVINVDITDKPDVWAETEGKAIRNQFPSARFEFLQLGVTGPDPAKVVVKRAKE